MQTRETKEIPRRIRYYESLIDINSLEKGSSYRNLKDTIIIFICNFDMFKKNLPRYDFRTYCTQDKTIELDSGIVGRESDEQGKAFWVDEYKEMLSVYGSESATLKAIADRMVHENELKELANKMGFLY